MSLSDEYKKLPVFMFWDVRRPAFKNKEGKMKENMSVGDLSEHPIKQLARPVGMRMMTQSSSHSDLRRRFVLISSVYMPASETLLACVCMHASIHIPCICEPIIIVNLFVPSVLTFLCQ